VYIMPILVMFTGYMPIVWTGLPFLCLFLAWLISGMIVNEIFSWGYAKTVWMEEYNFLRLFTFIKATFALIIPLNWSFAVTPKTLTSNRRLPVRLWPQVILASSAILAIPIGSYLYHQNHHLPQGAFLANLLWVVLTGSIAIKALHFSTGNRRQRRSDHRFAIPLAVEIKASGAEGKTMVVIAQDVSSNGFSFQVNDERSLGDHLEGELKLPSGALPFTAHLMSGQVDPARGSRRIAVQFQWDEPGQADRLNACLYGNSMQWDVNSWSETRNIPWRNRLSRWFGKPGVSANEWQFARIRSHDGRKIVCAARREGAAFRALAFDPLPSTSRLTLSIDDSGPSQAELRVVGYRCYPMDDGMIHMVVLSEADEPFASVYHREPAWYSRLEAV
jgi:cellulose synthase (UDP-forming)